MTEHKQVKLDRWGYEINTISDSCISFLNNYYHQVHLSIHIYVSACVRESQKREREMCILNTYMMTYWFVVFMILFIYYVYRYMWMNEGA